MDLLSLLRLTIRRWIVVVPVLLVTFGLSFYLLVNRGAEYEMAATYMLVRSDELTRSGAPLDPVVAVDVLDDLLLQQAVRDLLAADGLSTTYAVVIGETRTSLRLTVTGDDPEVVVETINTLVRMAPELLSDTFGDSATTVAALPVTFPTVADVTQSGDTYSVATSIVVSSVSEDTGNPFQPSLATVLSLIRLTTSADFENRIAEAAPNLQFEVTNSVREAALIDVTVTAPSAAEAAAGYVAVRDIVAAELRRLQDEAQVATRYRTVVRALYEPSTATATPASVIRPLAGIVLLGSGIAVGLAVFVESVSVGIRRGSLGGDGRRSAWSRLLSRRGAPSTSEADVEQVSLRDSTEPTTGTDRVDAKGGVADARIEADESSERQAVPSPDNGDIPDGTDAAPSRVGESSAGGTVRTPHKRAAREPAGER